MQLLLQLQYYLSHYSSYFFISKHPFPSPSLITLNTLVYSTVHCIVYYDTTTIQQYYTFIHSNTELSLTHPPLLQLLHYQHYSVCNSASRRFLSPLCHLTLSTRNFLFIVIICSSFQNNSNRTEHNYHQHHYTEPEEQYYCIVTPTATTTAATV